MTDEEMFQALGSLASEARVAKGRTKKEAAVEIGIADSTLRWFEQGHNKRFPQSGTLNAMETYYGWRRGAIKEVWDKRRGMVAGTLRMEDMLPDRPKGLIKAAHLTDQELMAELNFRFLMRDNREQFDG